MSRTVPEWVGKTDDAPIPARVKLRVFARADGRCQNCTAKLMPGVWNTDHIKSLINGGLHRESNLQALCLPCHKLKSRDDVAVKALTFRKQKAYHGLKKAKGKPILGTKASGWRHRMDGTWERR